MVEVGVMRGFRIWLYEGQTFRLFTTSLEVFTDVIKTVFADLKEYL